MDIMCKHVDILSDEQRMRPKDSEVDRLLADATRLRTLTGWIPEFAGRDGFRKGLELTVEWFLKHMDVFINKANRYVI